VTALVGPNGADKTTLLNPWRSAWQNRPQAP